MTIIKKPPGNWLNRGSHEVKYTAKTHTSGVVAAASPAVMMAV